MMKHATFLAGLALSFAAATAQAQDATADTVIATVGETEITLGQMIIARAQLPQQYTQFPDDVLFQGVLDQLIQQQVLAYSLTDGVIRGGTGCDVVDHLTSHQAAAFVFNRKGDTAW